MNIQYNITSLKNVTNNNKFDTNDKIFVCLYKINNNKNDYLPFLQYLLYKYPKGKFEQFLFPFKLYKKKKNPIDIAKKLAYSIANKNKLKYNGFISNNYGHYFFFHYLDDSIDLGFKDRNYELWWGLIDEICNKQKIINFPVHESVFNIFYNNTDLIYLTNNNNIPIEIPISAYFGGSSEIISYVASIGMRLNAEKAYGSYYYLGSYENQIKNAGWSSNNRIIHYFNKPVSDDNGKLFNGGLIRYALFLGNCRTILYRKTDPFYWYFQYLESDKFDDTIKKKADLAKGKWADKYDSLFIPKIKYKKIDGYYNINPAYIVKDFSQQIPLSIHSLDTKTLKSNWDPFFNKYYIK